MSIRASRSIATIASAAALALMTSPAAQVQTQYKLTLRDGMSDVDLDVGESTVEVDGNEAALKLAQKHRTFVVPPSAERIAVRAVGGGGYVNRQVTFLQDSGRLNRSIVIYLEKTPNQFSNDYLEIGLSRLRSDQVDRALALLQGAFDEPSRQQVYRLTLYEARLRYNYASALFKACTMLGYDTCDSAALRFGEILKDMESKREFDLFTEQRVTRAAVENALQDLKVHQVRRDYKRAVAQLASGDRASAIATLSALAEARKDNVEVFRKSQLTDERLAKDLAYANSIAY